MELNNKGLKETTSWEKAGYLLPHYDREKIRKQTMEHPVWIHFGAGNISRAFQSNLVQKLLNEHKMDCGLTVAEGYDYEIIEAVTRPCDNYHLLVTLKSDGNVEKSVIGSVMESLLLSPSYTDDFLRLQEIFQNDSLQLASFTITEKGYQFTDSAGSYFPSIASDMNAGPKAPESYLGKVTSLLYSRYLAGKAPIAMVSMDNCSHNGTRLYEAVFAFAAAWSKNGLTEPGFIEYIKDPLKVSFPWTMIDKITPRPDPTVEALLIQDGIEHMQTIVTSKHTYIAPFVNAEECEYLIIEDAFPNGRPPLEAAGVLFTTRTIVEKAEKMKVCTCLNPLHTSLAIFGCLLGYTRICDEMNDSELRRLAEGIGYQEGLPVITSPEILDPAEFLTTVLQVRLPNPFLPDTPKRIATDTSQKLAIRFGETVKSYVASPIRSVSDLTLIPLVFAGWLRYLMGIDDQGTPFTLSPDPMLKTLSSHLSSIHLGEPIDAEPVLRPILANAKIFGVNLYEVHLDRLVCQYFSELIKGPGAVRMTLKHTLDSLYISDDYTR